MNLNISATILLLGIPLKLNPINPQIPSTSSYHPTSSSMNLPCITSSLHIKPLPIQTLLGFGQSEEFTPATIWHPLRRSRWRIFQGHATRQEEA